MMRDRPTTRTPYQPPARPEVGSGAHVALAPSGVTLIELLITIMIISILAAVLLGVAAVAGETAREAKSRNMISRIHTLLMEHYDSYASRRVKLRDEVLDEIQKSTALTAAQKGQLKAACRLYALREMILMEIPDRWSDVLLEGVPPTSPLKVPVYLEVPNSTRRTDLANIYLRQYRRLAAATNKRTGNLNTPDEITSNQGAECLYMVVVNACGDGEARSLFPASSIGDTDFDGAPEFLDGWGHPIEFLRWAPGFESDIQINANELDNPLTGTSAAAWTDASISDHDPFDLYRVDPSAFRLVPLVFSAGRDETYSLRLVKPHVAWLGIDNPDRSFNPSTAPKLQPWAAVDNRDGSFVYLGTDNGDNASADNIHNHLISTR